MSRARVGLDLDGVVYEWDKTARYMLREVCPVPMTSYVRRLLEEESRSWDYIEDCVPPAAWNWLWSEGVRLGLFRYGHVVRGAINGVRELSRFADIEVITHRPANAVEDTLGWLSFMKLPLRGVHLLTHQEPKAAVKPAFDLYIEDKPENCNGLSQIGSVIMFARPWNEGAYLYERVHRVEGWPAVLEVAWRMFDAN
jgi:5'(3')-deoxyribonucleotidase